MGQICAKQLLTINGLNAFEATFYHHKKLIIIRHWLSYFHQKQPTQPSTMDFETSEVTVETRIVDGYTMTIESQENEFSLFLTNNTTNEKYFKRCSRKQYGDLEPMKKKFQTYTTIKINSRGTNNFDLNGTYTIFLPDIGLQHEIICYIGENEIFQQCHEFVMNKKHYTNFALKFVSNNDVTNFIKTMEKHFIGNTSISLSNWNQHPILNKLTQFIEDIRRIILFNVNRIKTYLNAIMCATNDKMAKLDKNLTVSQFTNAVSTILDEELKKTSVYLDVFDVDDNLQFCLKEPKIQNMFDFKNKLNIDEFVASKLPPTKCILGKYEILFKDTDLNTIFTELLKVSPLFTQENIRRVFYNVVENTIDFTVADTPAKKYVTDKLDEKLGEIDFMQK